MYSGTWFKNKPCSLYQSTNLSTTLIHIFLVESSDTVPPCPICEGVLVYRDSRKRIRRKEGGAKEHLQIRRFRCRACQSLHNELPDCLVPHKHYEAEVISGVIDDVITPDDLESEDYPCVATILRWLAWFRINLSNIEGMLRRAMKRSFTDLSTSLLDIIRSTNQRWLETGLRIIYNSGGRLSPAG